VIGLCDRWHKLPSEVLGEDVEVLRWLRVLELGDPPRQEQDPMAGMGGMGGDEFGEGW
jgi:hypothetical protein